MWVIDVSPVVACIGLAFMDQHCVKPIWNLQKRKQGNVRVGFIFTSQGERTGLLTCIIDLSEYISSMVL